MEKIFNYEFEIGIKTNLIGRMNNLLLVGKEI